MQSGKKREQMNAQVHKLANARTHICGFRFTPTHTGQDSAGQANAQQINFHIAVTWKESLFRFIVSWKKSGCIDYE